MAKRTTTETQDLIKNTFDKVKGNRAQGWGPEDSEMVIVTLLDSLQTESGKDIHLKEDSKQRIVAALQISPPRIMKLIESEVEKAGGVIDETTARYIRWLLDPTKVRTDLADAGIIKAAPKGKTKTKVVDLLK